MVYNSNDKPENCGNQIGIMLFPAEENRITDSIWNRQDQQIHEDRIHMIQPEHIAVQHFNHGEVKYRENKNTNYSKLMF